MPTQFNKQEYNKYLEAKNYDGLASYLEGLDIDDPILRDKVHSSILKLRETSRIRNAVMSMPGVDVDAINFVENIIATGKPGDDNIYGKKYNRKLNKLGSNSERQATRLGLNFSKEEDYNNFLNNIGLSENELKNSDINIFKTNGKISIAFAKNNGLVPSIINSIDIMSREEFYKGFYDYDNPLISAKAYKNTYNVTLSSYDDKGLITENTSPIELLRLQEFTKRISERGNKAFDEYKNNPEFNKTTASVNATPYLNAGDAKLEDDFKKGLLTPELYNQYKKQVNESTYNNLSLVYFTNYDEVYFKDSDSKTAELKRTIDPEKQEELTLRLHQAINDNRVTIRAAIVGDRIGSYITISPAKSSSNDKDDVPSGKRTGETVIFVPNLFKGECEDAFNRDTRTRAAKERWNIDRYNYTYRLDDGSEVGYTDFIQYDYNGQPVAHRGAFIKGKNGQPVEISDEELVNALNRQFIKDDAVWGLYNERLDNNFYKNQEKTVSQNLKDANPDIQIVCESVMKDMFPGLNPNSEKYAYELDKLFGEIYNKLNNYKK